jgi:hypothetical protein
MHGKKLGAKNRDLMEVKHGQRVIDNQSIMGEWRTLRETDPPKFLEVSISAEFVVSSVYANTTFGVLEKQRP